MDTQTAIIIAAIIGAVGAIAASIVRHLLEKRKEEKQKLRPVERGEGTINNKAGDEQPTGMIEFPVNKSKVPHILKNVEGKCFSLPEENWLWLVTYPHHYPFFHPQGAKIRHKNNHWKGFAAIGADKNESNKVYDLLLVIANDRASTIFEAYLRHARETNEWNGLDDLPTGSRELARITVYKQKG